MITLLRLGLGVLGRNGASVSRPHLEIGRRRRNLDHPVADGGLVFSLDTLGNEQVPVGQTKGAHPS